MNNTINFMYFAHNFKGEHLTNIFKLLGNEEHFNDKFHSMRGDSGTEKFFRWFMELSDDNKEVVTNYVEQNYSYK